ncbi:hypothetical protein AB0E08_07865 [Streptomyces sp. NPDC048281]|uniref:hypothetical protein n=1 Tax=Streptomyces sp. NPDC048281 TaxID=3154715 RepID=UPI003440A29D
MRTATISASELGTRSWSSVEHIPGDPSEEGKRLVAAYQRAKAVHEDAPDDGSAAILAILGEAAAKRARSRPNSLMERTRIKADHELFVRVGLLES